jgi:hypothetical protein
MTKNFAELVRAMEPAALEALRQSVATELGARRQHTSLQLENIHPRMSDEERSRALQEIGRVLRGEENV